MDVHKATKCDKQTVEKTMLTHGPIIYQFIIEVKARYNLVWG